MFVLMLVGLLLVVRVMAAKNLCPLPRPAIVGRLACPIARTVAGASQRP